MNKSGVKLIFLIKSTLLISCLSGLLLLSGCKDTIPLSSPSLSVGVIAEKNSETGVGSYLIFEFTVKESFGDLTYDDALLQVRVTLKNKGNIISEDIGRGPYGWNGRIASGFDGVDTYAAFLYQNLEVYSGETGTSQKLLDIDFDEMEVFVRYTHMLGEKFRSNKVIFTKEELQKVMHQEKIVIQTDFKINEFE